MQNCNVAYCPFKKTKLYLYTVQRINESHHKSLNLDSVAQSQWASVLAKAAVTDQARLPDDMASPCLHIHKTQGIYGDSWGRQGDGISSLC